MPHADVVVDEPLVRRLLTRLPARYGELATRPLLLIAQGWDNAVWRVGADHAIRVPVRAETAGLIEREARWLPDMAAPLMERGIRVPTPLHLGRAGDVDVDVAYPFPWLLVDWVPGVVLTGVPAPRRGPVATALASGLPALHRRAPDNAPANRWRGVPLAARRPITRRHAHDARLRLGHDVARRLVQLIAIAEASPPWPHRSAWCHGDLHAGNLTLDGDTLGVLDFGDLTRGDPAVDLRVLWLVLTADQRAECLDAWAGETATPYDPHMPDRAKGWAASFVLAVASDEQGRVAYSSEIDHACAQLGA